MKKVCLSEEIFEVISNEESHYERRSFEGKARRISPVFARFDLASRMTKNTLFCRIQLNEKQQRQEKWEIFSPFSFL